MKNYEKALAEVTKINVESGMREYCQKTCKGNCCTPLAREKGCHDKIPCHRKLTCAFFTCGRIEYTLQKIMGFDWWGKWARAKYTCINFVGDRLNIMKTCDSNEFYSNHYAMQLYNGMPELKIPSISTAQFRKLRRKFKEMGG